MRQAKRAKAGEAGRDSSCLAQSGPPSIHALPEEVLESLLFMANQQGHSTRDTLSLVCRRWSALIARSALFWRSTCLSLTDIKVSLAFALPKRRQAALRRRVLGWMRERAGLVQQLHLLDCHRMPVDLPTMLQALASPALRGLRLDSCAGDSHKVLRAVAGGMQGLRSLEIDHAPRMAVPTVPPARYAAGLLCTLSALEHLTLHVPRLAEGGLSGLVRSLTALKTLHVCCEEDYELKLDHLGGLGKLEQVTLTGAVLGPLPHAASRLTSLTSICLSEVRCMAGGESPFWDSLARLPNLRALSSRHCDMRGTNLSHGVLALSALRSLELSSYLLNLPDLPSGALPQLTLLEFQGCHVLHFPPSWCSLPALHTLRFKSSPPDALPDEISRLSPTLRDLTLEGGASRCLLPCCQLSALSALKLSHMDFLATLPPGPYLSSLRRLDLSGNRFLSLPPALIHCERLEELDLSLNHRLQLEPGDVRDVLVHLTALKTLHLHKEGVLCDVGASPWDLRSVQALMALAVSRTDLKVCLDASCRHAAAE